MLKNENCEDIYGNDKDRILLINPSFLKKSAFIGKELLTYGTNNTVEVKDVYSFNCNTNEIEDYISNYLSFDPSSFFLLVEDPQLIEEYYKKTLDK